MIETNGKRNMKKNQTNKFSEIKMANLENLIGNRSDTSMKIPANLFEKIAAKWMVKVI